MRLGASFAALMANKWFDTFDWDKLMDKELSPPYIPPKDKMINDKDFKKVHKYSNGQDTCFQKLENFDPVSSNFCIKRTSIFY